MDYWFDKPCCYTCLHWENDARRRMGDTIARWKREGHDLTLIDGVAEDGVCRDGPQGVNVEIHGDAWADVTTDANFHCPGYEKD
jgi:hypothetical protein